MQTGKKCGKGLKMIVAGGKTGGHLFPGIAIASAFKDANRFNDVLFVGTGEVFETTTLDYYGFAHAKIDCSAIKGKTLKAKLLSAVNLPVSVLQAVKVIKEFRPDIVLGVGGFSAGPVVLAARFCGVKTAIHEQNSIPGLTNRILSGMVHMIFTSFEDTKGLFFKSKKIFCFGNPVRQPVGLKTEQGIKKTVPERADERFSILVTGGSQGAASINRAFLDAVKMMEHPGKYSIIHQTGVKDEKVIIREYEKIGIRARAGAFFHDMLELMQRADMIICRAGAGTISEISAVGKPSILVPYPYAANDHQLHNAEFMVKKKAAWLIKDSEITGEMLKEKIEFAADNPEVLESMAEAAGSLFRPFAADNIASKCIELAAR